MTINCFKSRNSKFNLALKIFSLIVFSIFLISCANFSKNISTTDLHESSYAYIFGYFKIETKKTFLAADGYQTMGLSFDCKDKKNYLVRFSLEEPLQAIKVKPSTCSLAEFIYTNADGVIRSRKSSPEGLLKNIKIQPDTAYYLGDMHATSLFTSFGTSYTLSWKIDSITNNFTDTAANLKRKYGNLKHIPTNNALAGKLKPIALAIKPNSNMPNMKNKALVIIGDNTNYRWMNITTNENRFDMANISDYTVMLPVTINTTFSITGLSEAYKKSVSFSEPLKLKIEKPGIYYYGTLNANYKKNNDHTEIFLGYSPEPNQKHIANAKKRYPGAFKLFKPINFN